MEIPLTCPKCSKGTILNLSDEEATEVKEKILSGGRSPTLLATCPSGHELIITLYFRNDEFGIRDVVMPMRADEENNEVSEIDWVSKAFGGGD
jgi:hypothetical protein